MTMMSKVFIVSYVDSGGYDSWEVSYHRTRKGALKYIMKRHYDNWVACRYIAEDSYNSLYFYVSDHDLNE